MGEIFTQKLKRPAAIGMCLLILLGLIVTAAPSAGATWGPYDTAEEMGIKDWWHYNAIIFGDWRAKEADNEGAIAVGGNVTLAEKSSFTIAANSDHAGPVIGDYVPIDHPYPAALLGFDTSAGQGIKMGPGIVISEGDIVFRDGSQSAVSGQPGISYGRGGRAFYSNGSAIDEFFDIAKTNTTKIFQGFVDTGVPSVTASQFFGWNAKTPSPTAYESSVVGPDGESILMLNFSDTGHINLTALLLTSAYAKYDLVVLNFPNAGSVNFPSGSGVYVDGGAVYSNASSGAAQQRQIEWASRLLWLFPNATSINIGSENGGGGGCVVGSVVAPKATVQGFGGNLNGMLIAQNFMQENSFELHALGISPLVPKMIDEIGDPYEPNVLRNLQIAKVDETVNEDVIARAEPFAGGDDDETNHTILPGAALELQYYDDATATYKNYYNDYPSANAANPIITTSGVLTLYDLVQGMKYRLVELKSPSGYELPPGEGIYTYFEISKDGKIIAGTYTDKNGNELLVYGPDTDSLRIFNRRAEAPLELLKVEAGQSTGLAGAVFGLRTADGAVLHTALTTDANGRVQVPGLGVGVYHLYEHTPPSGFVRPPSGHYYTITVTDERAAGAPTADLAVQVTDWNGHTLAAGANGGYVVYEIENTRLGPGTDNTIDAEFLKIDAKTGQALAGAEFMVYMEVFDPQSESEYDLVYSPTDDAGENGDPGETRYWKLLDANAVSSSDTGNLGTIFTIQDVKIGDSFLLQEISAPDGYLLWDTPRIFTIELDEDPGQFVFRFFLHNTAENQKLGSIHFAKVDDEPVPGPVYGAKFMLFRKVNGSYVYTGRSVQLNNSNEYTSEVLPEGEYMLRESYQPDGFEIKNDDDRNTYFVIDFAAAGQSGSGTEADPYRGTNIGFENAIQIENTPTRIKFTAIKMDRSTGEVMEGVVFRVWYRATINDEWELFTHDNPEGIYVTDEYGVISGYLRRGLYKLEEMETWDGYKITSPMYYSVTEDTPDEVVLRIFNELRITGEADVYKVNAENTAQLLSGGQYTLYSVPDYEYRAVLAQLQNGELTPEDAINNATLWTPYPDTDSNTFTMPAGGPLTLAGLESGLYKLVETTPPDGYTLWGGSRDSILFEMVYEEENNKPVVYLGEIFGNHAQADDALVFANKAAPAQPSPDGGSVTLKKVDHYDNSKALPNTTFQLRRYTGADGDALMAQLPAMQGADALALANSLTAWSAFPSADSNTYRTGADGTAVVEGLIPGLYRVEEIIPPPGYMLWGDERDVIFFLVQDTGTAYEATHVLGAHVQGSEITFADIPLETGGKNGTPQTDENGGNPQTGDEAAAAIRGYIALCCAMPLALTGLAVVKRQLRKRRERRIRLYWKR